jgi:O-succinylhomoserine sulfhydrylase
MSVCYRRPDRLGKVQRNGQWLGAGPAGLSWLEPVGPAPIDLTWRAGQSVTTMKPQTGQDRARTRAWRPATRAVRGGTARTHFGETSEAIFVTSGYAYERAEDAAARFRGDQVGMTYSRLQNPTVQMLEERLCLLDGAGAARATATGMAAMTASLLCQLSAGDHLIAGRSLFGSCRWLTDSLLPRFGIEVSIVDGRDTDAWARARRPNTKVLFLETPANPTMDIVDVAAVAGIAHDAGAVLVVDNAFATPVIQRPFELGADVVAYSATKLMDGQGRVLAGAVLGSESFVADTLLPFLRNTGPTLSPFNAWVVLKSLETLELRVMRQSENALAVARFLDGRVPRLLYPGLPSHPQHNLAMSQMSTGGTILSFFVDGGRPVAHALLDALQLIDISNNVGDSRSLMTHPASTTHHGVAVEAREEMGVTEGMLRLSVGLEDPADLIEDLDQALEAIGL